MALNNKQIFVLQATSVHLCTTGFGDPCMITNFGPGILYLGDNLPVSVDNTNGFPLAAAGATFVGVNSRIDLNEFEGQVWGYAAGGNCQVALLENKPG